MGSFWQDYRTLSRFEFLPGISVAILIGIFLAASTFSVLFDPALLAALAIGLVVFYLLFNVGFQCNCWADWKVDEAHKTHLATAVRSIGRDALLKLWVGHVVVAVLLTVLLVGLTGRWILLVIVATGTFLGVSYSVEPFRFKAKGGLHAVMAFPVFTIPGLYSYLLVRDLFPIDAPVVAFLVLATGITLSHYGLVLLSQSEDVPEDRAEGLQTPGVAWGLPRTMTTSVVLSLTGSALTAFGFTILLALHHPLLLGLLALLIPGLLFPSRTLLPLMRKARAHPKDEEQTLVAIRKVMPTYPQLHGIPLGCIMLVSLILLVARSLLPAAPLLPW